jgi:hypothetical protein
MWPSKIDGRAYAALHCAIEDDNPSCSGLAPRTGQPIARSDLDLCSQLDHAIER